MKDLPLPYKCLDKGFVRLADHMGNDLSIVRNARLSFDADWRAGEDEGKDEKLIRYLWKHRHTTPFEAVTFTFEVKAPIFVFRQWHRHRTQSYNEVSARYTELEDEYYFPSDDKIGVQDTKNRQARILIYGKEIQRKDELSLYGETCRQAFSTYKELLEYGWPRELARMVIPLSTYSRMSTTMNLLNLFRFLELRLSSHAQYEIRVYAEGMLELIKDIVPVATSAFKESIAI